MPTTIYNRSEILNFFDLTTTQQEEVLSNYYQSIEEAETDSFVVYESKNKKFSTVLPLSQFMRISVKSIWDGIFGTSYFSAYFIKINRSGDQALIAEKYS